MAQKPKYHEIIVTLDLEGPDGNAYVILGVVANALRRAGLNKEAIKRYQTEATAGDYDHLLKVTGEWVTFKDFTPPPRIQVP